MAHDVFVSYSSKDKPTADAVCATLEAAAIRCWIAPRDIAPGADWGESIIVAIQGARAMVLVFSAHANESQQIKREVERAVHRGIPIIPLRIEDVLPERALEYFLSTPHWLDAFTPPLERHLQYLTAVVRQIIAGAPDAVPRPPPPMPVPLYRRRAVMQAGAAALVLPVGVLAWLALRPGPPPSFVGKWRASKVAIDVTLGANTVPLADLLAAAFAGPHVAATFAVTSLGQYTYSISAEDHGTVVVQPERQSCRAANETCGELVFTSALNRRSITRQYTLIPLSELGGPGVTSEEGAQAGDTWLTIKSSSWWINLYGKPTEGIVGRWRNRAVRIMYDTYALELEITATGAYRLRISSAEHGLFQAQNGQWTRTPSSSPAVSGRYEFSGPDTVTVASDRSTINWQRVD